MEAYRLKIRFGVFFFLEFWHTVPCIILCWFGLLCKTRILIFDNWLNLSLLLNNTSMLLSLPRIDDSFSLELLSPGLHIVRVFVSRDTMGVGKCVMWVFLCNSLETIVIAINLIHVRVAYGIWSVIIHPYDDTNRQRLSSSIQFDDLITLFLESHYQHSVCLIHEHWKLRRKSRICWES